MKKVSKRHANKCPYCNYKMSPDEGASEMSYRGRVKIWCANCGKAYYYLEKCYPNCEGKPTQLDLRNFFVRKSGSSEGTVSYDSLVKKFGKKEVNDFYERGLIYEPNIGNVKMV